MNKKDLILALYNIGAVRFGDFELKSGKRSSVYVDIRRIISYPDLLTSVANMMWQSLDKHNVDCVCGVPYTALPIATCIAVANKIPMVMRRKEKKSHGRGLLVEGVYSAGQNCLIVEDVITTAGSVLETTVDLEQVGLKITDVVAVIDREQGGRDNLKQRKLNLHTILTLTEILETLAEQDCIPASEKELIKGILANLR